MLAGFHKFGQQLAARWRGAETTSLTVDTSGLSTSQIETGEKTLQILGLDKDAPLTIKDAILFLFAVGLTLGLDKDAMLTNEDAVLFLFAVGLNPTDDLIDSKLRTLKLHDLPDLDYGQICHIWHSMLQDLVDEEEILRRAFQFFDKDGSGDISVAELRTTMHELGDLLTEEEIAAFMEIMDVNNDGMIGYEEFINTLKTQAPDITAFADADRHTNDSFTTPGARAPAHCSRSDEGTNDEQPLADSPRPLATNGKAESKDEAESPAPAPSRNSPLA
eukprot:gene26149-11873_t